METAVGALNDHAQDVFDAISTGLGFLIESLTRVSPLVSASPADRPPGGRNVVAPPLVEAVRVPGFVAPADHQSRLLAPTMETLSLVMFATLTCVAVGVPIGIAAAHRPRLYTVLRPILDLDADDPDLRLSHSDSYSVRAGGGARPDLDGDFLDSRADSPDLSRRVRGA
jgi:glycine betaine/proline transport system permease protein